MKVSAYEILGIEVSDWSDSGMRGESVSVEKEADQINVIGADSAFIQILPLAVGFAVLRFADELVKAFNPSLLSYVDTS
jgi:hypothetical protein